MDKNLLADLYIRDGVVRQPGTGYILACDPKLEEKNVPHANFFKYSAGAFKAGSLNFDAHSICITSIPEFALVMLAGFGEYAVTTLKTRFAGNIFDGQEKREKYGAFRVVTNIGGKAYAAGHRGMVYRLDGFVNWVRIDKGLPDEFKITAIDGFDENAIYAVGYAGSFWHFDGKAWLKIDLPTNVNLTAVKCADDGTIYVAGYNGVLIRGRADSWDIIAEGETTEVIWDLECFEGELYISTIAFLYRLKKKNLERVQFDDDPPETCYHLSTAKDVLWSIGSSDVMSFDGKRWIRAV